MPTEHSLKYLKCIPFILEAEGNDRITDHPSDPGGLTKWGVSKAAFPPELITKILGYPKDIRELNRSEAIIIWHTFWLKCGAENLPYPLAMIVFDCAVNCGVRTSTILLQRALKVKEDGIFGPRTISASQSVPLKGLVCEYIRLRKRYYRAIIERNSNLRTFYEGWLNRLFNVTFEVMNL